MQKVLIISYFFPPCNLTASQRVVSWAKYLHKSGYYPIIITRKWEKHVTSFDDCHYPTSKEVLIEDSYLSCVMLPWDLLLQLKYFPLL